MRLLLLCALTIGLLSTHDSLGRSSAIGKGKRLQVRLQLKNYAPELRYLQQNGFDVAGVDIKKNQVAVIANTSEVSYLQTRGYKVLQQIDIDRETVDPQYKTPQAVAKLMAKYAADYPELTYLASVGKSLEGRDIWAMKITKDAARAPSGKPTVLFNGMHHAREVMTPEVPLDIADYLLTHYGKDPKVTHWVDSNEIWVMPMLNVDGNQIVWDKDNMWRKNARDGHGVDINRNYPYAWGSCNGSSGSPSSEIYRGSSAGSEPETQVMMGLVQAIHPIFDISFHSFSELVIYPYGCDEQKTPSWQVVEGIGKEIADLLPSDTGSGNYTPGTSWETLYAVDGGDIDWMYHEYAVIPYVIELNSFDTGFQPSFKQWRDKTVAKVRAAWMHLLDRVEGGAIKGKMLRMEDQQPIQGATIVVEGTDAGSAFRQVYPVQADGSFYIILNPGKFDLSFKAPNHQTETHHVEVESKPIEFNVNLWPALRSFQ